MPPGAPYNSFILPYRIRVDHFTASASQDCAPSLHLLTHTHSDHIGGLSAQSFGYKVICSRDAKEMLLRHEVYAERELLQLEFRTEKTRTFSHLKVDPLRFPDGTMYYVGSRDLLETLPLHTPTSFELSNSESVTITAFEANHCPGAVMFLVEGSQGAILHTGDFRAETWFLESMTRNPFLQPYLAPRDGYSGYGKFAKTLEAIYLDTASVFSTISVPTKERATSGLVDLMKLFPKACYFFINAWTWGYEDILKAISREFSSSIHVDRYKHSVYSHISDPFLRSIISQNPSSTRFHACERFHRCEYVAVDDDEGARGHPMEEYNTVSRTGKRVVYVNPVHMGAQAWELYIRETKTQLESGEEVNNLLVPLYRHSPLPELRDFVALFRPRRVVPNTLDPRLHGLDWAAINNMFANCLYRGSVPIPPGTIADPDGEQLGSSGDEDVALKNLVGDGAADLASRWAESGGMQKRVEVLRGYLDSAQNSALDRLLGVDTGYRLQNGAGGLTALPPNAKGKGKERAVDSEDESDDGWGSADDERGRTAHTLFASDGMKEYEWWVSSSPDAGGGDVLSQMEELEKGRREKKMKSGAPEGQGSIGVSNLLTPETSPARPSRLPPPPLSALLAAPALASPAPPPVAIPQPHKRPPESVQPMDASLDTNRPAKRVEMPREELGSPFSPSRPPRPLAGESSSVAGAQGSWRRREEKRNEKGGAIDGSDLGPLNVRDATVLSSPLLAVQNDQGRNFRGDAHVASSSRISDERETSLIRKKGMMEERTRHDRTVDVRAPALAPLTRKGKGKGGVSRALSLAEVSQKSIEVLSTPSFPVRHKARKESRTTDNFLVASSSKTFLPPPCSPPLVEVDINNDSTKMGGGVDGDVDPKSARLGTRDQNSGQMVHYGHVSSSPRSLRGLYSRRRERLSLSPYNARSLTRPQLPPPPLPLFSPSGNTAPPANPVPRVDLSRIADLQKEKRHSKDKQQRTQGPEIHAIRLRIAEGLANARPDLVVPTYEKKRVQLLARLGRSPTKEKSAGQRCLGMGEAAAAVLNGSGCTVGLNRTETVSSFKTVEDGDGGMDWNRSRQLAEAVREDLKNGRRPVLPMLMCTDSQNDEI